MTGDAIRRHRLELAGRASLVAGTAIYRCMCAHQWKPIVVLLQLPH